MAMWIVLICAVMASLASGVLLAYGVCLAMFRFVRMHSISLAGTDAAAASTSAARETAIAR
jgi:hypothetical protein